MTDDVLQSQIDYYRARAPEYDQWWRRERMFDLGPDFKREWDAEVGEVEHALHAFGVAGRVLELASGTGWWTERLARSGDELVCVDASPETIEIARARAPSARFVQADIFDWEPDGAYDVVFFSFWLSHVPDDRFDRFWATVRRALDPGGRVFFVDNLRPYANPPVDGRQRRTLNDGREFTIVKHYFEPPALEARLRELGWHADVRATANHFLYATAS